MKAMLLMSLIGIALAMGTPARGQVASGAEKKPATAATPAALDSAQLELFLRRYFSWPNEVRVTISPLKPSVVAGLIEAKVKIVHQGQEQETTFLVSADGKHLLQGPPMELGGDPFAATRAKIVLKDSPSLGSPLAPVTIVEYSDFQCGFCRGAAQVLTGPVIRNFQGQVRLVYKDFPLTAIHAWATPAATLGRCIHKRYGDGFWAYHDWVFFSQPQLTAENFKQKALAFAKEKGMDTADLGACMERPAVKAEVERSVAEAESVGVSGTPTLFINGRKVVGVQSFEQVRPAIQAELDYARGK